MYERAQMDGNSAKREEPRATRERRLRRLLLYMDGSLVKNLGPTERVPRVGGYHKYAERFTMRAGSQDIFLLVLCRYHWFCMVELPHQVELVAETP